MMVVFEVVLAPGASDEALLSTEVVRETQAQIMTLDEAAKVGFAGLSPAEEGREVRLIAVARRDAPWIHRALETNEAVGGFSVHEVDV